MIRRRFLVHSALASAALAQRLTYPPELPGSRTEVYKEAGGAKLQLWIYEPAGHKPADKRAAIVFFFGGGWTNGSPKQFEQHCKMLAERGMVAITADYRVASRHQVKAVDCVRDAKSAVRYVRRNAARLGVDPNRIAAGGGSAGGHLAAAIATVKEFDEESEDRAISSRPNALVLFNPALVLAGARVGVERAGVDPERISPASHVSKGAPPAIIFHGKADTTVPYATAETFAQRMAAVGSRCELVGYEGQTHGFFNYGRGGNEYFEKTTRAMLDFLKSLGYLT